MMLMMSNAMRMTMEGSHVHANSFLDIVVLIVIILVLFGIASLVECHDEKKANHK